MSAPKLKSARPADSARLQTRLQPAAKAALLSRSRRVAITLPRSVPRPARRPRRMVPAVLSVQVVLVVVLSVQVVPGVRGGGGGVGWWGGRRCEVTLALWAGARWAPRAALPGIWRLRRRPA